MEEGEEEEGQEEGEEVKGGSQGGETTTMYGVWMDVTRRKELEPT